MCFLEKISQGKILCLFGTSVFLLEQIHYIIIFPLAHNNLMLSPQLLDIDRPALMLPGASKPVIAVRFCPMTFSLRGSSNCTFSCWIPFWANCTMLCLILPSFLMTAASFFKLPYRLIFAVATLNSLYIYDTESVRPIAVVAGLHYAAVTDIAWYSWLPYSFSNAVSTCVLFHEAF